MAYLNQTRTTQHGVRTGLGTIFAHLRESLERYAAYRRTVRELNQLSDHDLADLGFNRSMIPAVAMDATSAK